MNTQTTPQNIVPAAAYQLTLDNGSGTVTFYFGDWIVDGFDIQTQDSVWQQKKPVSIALLRAMQAAADRAGQQAAWNLFHARTTAAGHFSTAKRGKVGDFFHFSRLAGWDITDISDSVLNDGSVGTRGVPDIIVTDDGAVSIGMGFYSHAEGQNADVIIVPPRHIFIDLGRKKGSPVSFARQHYAIFPATPENLAAYAPAVIIDEDGDLAWAETQPKT